LGFEVEGATVDSTVSLESEDEETSSDEAVSVPGFAATSIVYNSLLPK
jgi:hypothetical protein